MGKTVKTLHLSPLARLPPPLGEEAVTVHLSVASGNEHNAQSKLAEWFHKLEVCGHSDSVCKTLDLHAKSLDLA